ncbi:MAG: sulfite exporter TauE/SafE family protein [bacterium]|nr:sulfite exporter TauE/SafE family protein [bacterium]MCP5065796.1 sulfite exporter TauE/SafE family protein [bacterium]
MTPIDASLLIGGGLLAGIVNTLAGGGSMLTVPLLVMVGLPGTLANGTNRVGILIQNGVASWGFWAQGVGDLRRSLPVILPVAAGAGVGALVASHLPDDVFERIFGVIMLLLLVPTLRGVSRPSSAPARHHPGWLRSIVFIAIGLYGGAFQAGVGLLLVAALSFGGIDLVRANSIKVMVNFCFTLLAVPIFIAAGQVSWPEALTLGAGFAAGGALGARLAVRGGERLIRPVLALAILAPILAGE